MKLPFELLLHYQRNERVLGVCISKAVRVVLTLGRAYLNPRRYELFIEALGYIGCFYNIGSGGLLHAQVMTSVFHSNQGIVKCLNIRQGAEQSIN
jgi:hypothetical protein